MITTCHYCLFALAIFATVIIISMLMNSARLEVEQDEAWARWSREQEQKKRAFKEKYIDEA